LIDFGIYAYIRFYSGRGDRTSKIMPKISKLNGIKQEGKSKKYQDFEEEPAPPPIHTYPYSRYVID
jgi:hypothetical protein